MLTPGSVFIDWGDSKTPGLREVIMNFCVAVLSRNQLHILIKSVGKLGRQTRYLPGDLTELMSVMCLTCLDIVQTYSYWICTFLQAVC